MNKLSTAFEIATVENNDAKWKQIADLALINGKIDIAIKCLKASNDINGLFLIYSSLGLKENLRELAQKAEETLRINIAFSSYFLIVKIKIKFYLI